MSADLQSPKAYIAPFATFLLFLAGGDLLAHFSGPERAWVLSQPRYWILPLQTVVCGGLLLRYWSKLHLWEAPRRLGATLGIGLLVFLLWIVPRELFGAPARVDGFDPGFAGNGWLSTATLGLRFVRLVLVVPLLEEIFWRGFLLRYLIEDDFRRVPFGQFRLGAFAGVTLCFGLAHSGPDFLPALAAGALYNFVACLTGRLSSCVLAHALTNLLLGSYIMETRQWGFW